MSKHGMTWELRQLDPGTPPPIYFPFEMTGEDTRDWHLQKDRDESLSHHVEKSVTC